MEYFSILVLVLHDSTANLISISFKTDKDDSSTSQIIQEYIYMKMVTGKKYVKSLEL